MNYIAIDQYGHTYPIAQYPRKELQALFGGHHDAQKMYIDQKDGKKKHVGYVIGGLWLHVFKLTEAWPIPTETA